MKWLLNLLKKWLTPDFKKLRANVVAEIQRAIKKLEAATDQTGAAVVDELYVKLTEMIGGSTIQAQAAQVLISVLFQSVKWDELAGKGRTEILTQLRILKGNAERASL